MKKNLLFILPLFVANLSFGQWVDSVRIQTTGFDGGVAVSTDDAEQKNNEIDKLYDDDLDMGWEGDEFNVVSTGLRFRGVNVPHGATIDSAFIEMWAHEDEGDLAIITIFAEDADNPVTYNETDLISDRPRTSASVVWECDEEWTIWEQYRTPDIKALVQEVVDRSGWQQGNAMAFYLTGQDQGASEDDNGRDFEGFENVADPDDGGDGLNHPDRVAKLVIYFSGVSPVKERSVVANMKVTPSPVTGNFMRVALDAFQGEDVTMTLFDLSGKAVQVWQRDNLREVSLKLDVNAMPGIYALEIVSANKIGVAKVAVQ
jgi:hypothetical protein